MEQMILYCCSKIVPPWINLWQELVCSELGLSIVSGRVSINKNVACKHHMNIISCALISLCCFFTGCYLDSAGNIFDFLFHLLGQAKYKSMMDVLYHGTLDYSFCAIVKVR